MIGHRRYSELANWGATFQAKERIVHYAELERDRVLVWKGKGTNMSLSNACDTIRTHRPKDECAKGIWASGTPSLLLWRVC